ncbi:MAG: protein kinase [Archangiaceae bacterium]|nr:protein kinase [Archangiaceae bacterium]
MGYRSEIFWLRVSNAWESLTGDPLHIEGEARASALEPGSSIAGRYQIRELLGAGGMGRVWLVNDTLEKRDVALKEMKTSALRAQQQLKGSGASDTLELLFKREFFTMSKLSHPGSVKVYDYGQLPSGDHYITMEVVRGSDLSKLVARGPLELGRVYQVLAELSTVLGFIHSRLFVHCDIKADNLRLTPRGNLKLVDFGLMHQLGTPAGTTLKGTPQYMPPEIPKGGIIDARTDLYSMGVLAFELVTGKLPFTGKNLGELLRAHQSAPVPRLKSFREVPEGLQALIDRLLAKEPKDRPADASAVLRELERFTGIAVSVGSVAQRTSYLASAELVGRASQAAQLKGALDAVQAGKGKSLFILAPGGVGKTRLLQEFRLQVKLADVPLSVGYCRAQGQAPLQAIVQALTPLLEVTPRELLDVHGPALVKLLPAVAALGYAPSASKDPLERSTAVTGWLKGLAKVRPFVVCLEDLHWADSGTIEVMNVIIRALVDEPAMLLGTFRSNEVDRISVIYQTMDEGLADRLQLEPLSEADTVQLLGLSLKGFAPPAGFATRLHQATGGNAFFLTETLRALIEAQALQLTSTGWALREGDAPLPATIAEVVEKRLGLLPEGILGLCRQIAPLGQVVEPGVARAVTGLPDDRFFQALDELVERQFLQQVEKSYYFTHETLRAAVYGSTPEAQRRAHHQRIAEVLEERTTDAAADAAQLGYHFSLGTERRRAISHLMLAAERALAAAALMDAHRIYKQAADLIEEQRDPALADLMLDCWSKVVDTGFNAHPPTAVQMGKRLIAAWAERMDLAQGEADFSRAHRRYQSLPRLVGDKMLKRLYSERPFRASSRDTAEIVPRLQLYRGTMTVSCGALGWVDECNALAQAVLEANPDPESPYRAMAWCARSAALFHRGEWTQQQREIGESVDIFDRHMATIGVMPARMHYWHGLACYWDCIGKALMGKPLDPARLKAGREISEKHGLGDVRFYLAMSELNRASVTGDFEAFNRIFAALQDPIRRAGHPRLMESRVYIWLPLFFMARAESEKAGAVLRKLEGFSKVLKDTWLNQYAAIYGAIEAVDRRMPDAAERVEAALGEARRTHHGRLAMLLCAKARHLRTQGRVTEARAAADEALTQARGEATANPLDEAMALREVGRCEGGAAGAALVREAVEVARRNQNDIETGHGLVALAELLAPADPGAAERARGEAHELFRKQKADRLLEPVR